MARRDSPIGRIFNLAAYIQARGVLGCTRAEIAQDVPEYNGLSVSALAKKLERDRTDLADGWGITLQWSDERQRYTLQPPFFTSAERRALIAAAATVGVEGNETVGQDGELGTAVERDAAQVVVRVHDRVVELRDAIAARQSIQLRYNGEVRVIDPYVLGMWRNRWYLAGFDHLRGNDRKFRLDRLEQHDDEPALVAVGEPGAFTIPNDFDPIAALEMDPNAWGSDEPVSAVVRVERDLVPLLLGELQCEVGTVTADDVILTIEVRDYESFIIRLLGFGTAVRLLEPPVLVERMQAWLRDQVTV